MGIFFLRRDLFARIWLIQWNSRPGQLWLIQGEGRRSNWEVKSVGIKDFRLYLDLITALDWLWSDKPNTNTWSLYWPVLLAPVLLQRYPPDGGITFYYYFIFIEYEFQSRKMSFQAWGEKNCCWNLNLKRWNSVLLS